MYIALLMLMLAYFLLKEYAPRAVGRSDLVKPSKPRERPDRQQDEYG